MSLQYIQDIFVGPMVSERSCAAMAWVILPQCNSWFLTQICHASINFHPTKLATLCSMTLLRLYEPAVHIGSVCVTNDE